MIKHIVLFKMKEDTELAVKLEAMHHFRRDILNLRSVIPCIRELEVGFNCNSTETWEICLNSSFDNLEDLHAYATHPQHIAASQRLKPLLADRACVDYED